MFWAQAVAGNEAWLERFEPVVVWVCCSCSTVGAGSSSKTVWFSRWMVRGRFRFSTVHS